MKLIIKRRKKPSIFSLRVLKKFPILPVIAIEDETILFIWLECYFDIQMYHRFAGWQTTKITQNEAHARFFVGKSGLDVDPYP